MKNIFIILLCLSGVLKAQNEIPKNGFELDASYYNLHTGHSVNLEVRRTFKNHSLLLGLSCHLNHYIQNSQYAYLKQFYATTAFNRFGLTAGYEYKIKEVNPYVQPYIFYNAQLTHMPTLHRYNLTDSLGMTYVSEAKISKPITGLVNTLGVGLRIKLSEKLYLNQSIGGGVFLIHDADKNYKGWELGYQWRMGLTYKI
ncbi:MAG: hypothetical protein JNK50_05125 [Bacteroidia bacterium]|nr:hypothetical protein [Bacteroidia bacterium]